MKERKTLPALEAYAPDASRVNRSKAKLSLKMIYEQAPIGIALIDSTTFLIDEVNQRFAEIAFRPKEELIALDWVSLMHPDDAKEYLDNVGRMNKGEIHFFKTEKRYLRPDGTIVWTRMTVVPTSKHVQINPRHLCMVEDMTEQKRMESMAAHAALRYRRLFESSRDGILVMDFESGLIEDVNPFFVSLFGYDKEDYIGKRFHELDSMRNIPLVKEIRSLLLDNTHIHAEDLQWETKTGMKLEVAFDASVYKVDGISTIQCIFRDETVRKQMERALSDEKRLVETTLNSIGDGVFSTDTLGNITTLNSVAELLTGWTKDEAMGRPSHEVFSIFNRTTGEKRQDIVREVLEKGGVQSLAASTFLVSRYGVELPIEDSAAPIIQKNGDKAGVVVVFRDTADKERHLGRIEYLSYHDQLTGLYNRRFFEEELSRLDTERNLPLTIGIGDINGLKLINDSFGHKMGDSLLKKTSDVIRRCCRADDIVARLGGDEFVIILPNTDARKADRIVQRIIEYASQERVGSVMVSISIGHATKVLAGSSIQMTLQTAEENMYRNKLYEGSSMRSQTINLIMNALFEKSSREMLHSHRVSALCEAIGKQMGFDNTGISQLRTAGLMHDIGKVGIDESILSGLKPLNKQEWKDIQKHPEVGYRILNSVNELSDIASFVLEHHERWDGRGYPKGLSNDMISLQARIIAVADAYDAMTSARTYKKTFSREGALKEIQHNASFQFDPTVVACLLRLDLDAAAIVNPNKVGLDFANLSTIVKNPVLE
jgi:diguanylate cyclase